MKSKPVLIFKSYLTGFPTALPASVYAMPDGTIYLVYTRFYEKDFSNTGLNTFLQDSKRLVSILKRASFLQVIYLQSVSTNSN